MHGARPSTQGLMKPSRAPLSTRNLQAGKALPLISSQTGLVRPLFSTRLQMSPVNRPVEYARTISLIFADGSVRPANFTSVAPAPKR